MYFHWNPDSLHISNEVFNIAPFDKPIIFVFYPFSDISSRFLLEYFPDNCIDYNFNFEMEIFNYSITDVHFALVIDVFFSNQTFFNLYSRIFQEKFNYACFPSSQNAYSGLEYFFYFYSQRITDFYEIYSSAVNYLNKVDIIDLLEDPIGTYIDFFAYKQFKDMFLNLDLQNLGKFSHVSTFSLFENSINELKRKKLCSFEEIIFMKINDIIDQFFLEYLTKDRTTNQEFEKFLKKYLTMYRRINESFQDDNYNFDSNNRFTKKVTNSLEFWINKLLLIQTNLLINQI